MQDGSPFRGNPPSLLSLISISGGCLDPESDLGDSEQPVSFLRITLHLTPDILGMPSLYLLCGWLYFLR